MSHLESKRPTISELKADWCRGDLRIIAGLIGNRVAAMPLAEAVNSERYFELLKGVKTYQDAQDLYENFSIDPDAPKLTPILLDLKSDLELMDARVQQEFRKLGKTDPNRWEDDLREMSDDGYVFLKEDFPCTIDSLWEEVKNLDFDVNSDPTYNFDGIPKYISPYWSWTDRWLPAFIVEGIGSADNAYGLDYEPAEYVFEDLEVFKSTLETLSFEVIFDDQRVQFLAIGWV